MLEPTVCVLITNSAMYFKGCQVDELTGGMTFSIACMQKHSYGRLKSLSKYFYRTFDFKNIIANSTFIIHSQKCLNSAPKLTIKIESESLMWKFNWSKEVANYPRPH